MAFSISFTAELQIYFIWRDYYFVCLLVMFHYKVRLCRRGLFAMNDVVIQWRDRDDSGW